VSRGTVQGYQRHLPTRCVPQALTASLTVDSCPCTLPFTFLTCLQGRGSGVSFALPTEMLREVVPNLIVYGSASGRGVRGATPS
jgi:hypothetical protein